MSEGEQPSVKSDGMSRRALLRRGAELAGGLAASTLLKGDRGALRDNVSRLFGAHESHDVPLSHDMESMMALTYDLYTSFTPGNFPKVAFHRIPHYGPGMDETSKASQGSVGADAVVKLALPPLGPGYTEKDRSSYAQFGGSYSDITTVIDLSLEDVYFRDPDKLPLVEIGLRHELAHHVHHIARQSEQGASTTQRLEQLREKALSVGMTELCRVDKSHPFQLFDEFSYEDDIPMCNPTGPERNSNELFAHGLTTMVAFPSQFLEAINSLTGDHRTLAVDIKNTILSIVDGQAERVFGQNKEAHLQQLIPHLKQISQVV
jgi:hypothetical protein